jgi:hypothetical protein
MLLPVLFGVVVLTSLPPASVAQSAPACTTLLTAAEVQQAVGTAMEDMGAEERTAGESSCPWMARGGPGGFKTVSVQFYTTAAIDAMEAYATADAFFASLVEGAEGVASGKHEVVDGMGQKAAFVPTDPQMLLVVQRPDGVARIVTNNVTKDQILAVGRAVAAP